MSAKHPGDILKNELRVKGMSQSELARRLGVTRSHVSDIIRGRRGICARLALKLELVLGPSAFYWMKAQAVWDLELARTHGVGV